MTKHGLGRLFAVTSPEFILLLSLPKQDLQYTSHGILHGTLSLVAKLGPYCLKPSGLFQTSDYNQVQGWINDPNKANCGH